MGILSNVMDDLWDYLASNHQLWRCNGHFIPQHGESLLDMADDKFLNSKQTWHAVIWLSFSGQFDHLQRPQTSKIR